MIAMEHMEALNREALPSISLITGDDLGYYSQLKEAFLRQIGYDLADLSTAYFDLSVTPYSDKDWTWRASPFLRMTKWSFWITF